MYTEARKLFSSKVNKGDLKPLQDRSFESLKGLSKEERDKLVKSEYKKAILNKLKYTKEPMSKGALIGAGVAGLSAGVLSKSPGAGIAGAALGGITGAVVGSIRGTKKYLKDNNEDPDVIRHKVARDLDKYEASIGENNHRRMKEQAKDLMRGRPVILKD